MSSHRGSRDLSLSRIPGDAQDINDTYNGPHSNSLDNFIASYKRSLSFTGLNVEGLSPRLFDEAVEEEDLDENSSLLRFPSNKSRHGSIVSVYTTITGNSTLPQTIFNSINVLVGVALLSLPYGLRLSGMIIGTCLLIGCYLVTMSTAKILGDVLKKHPHLVTYGDIAGYSLGPKFEIVITAFFVVDITGALISLSLLFSSSFASLFPVNEAWFKVIIYVVMFFTSFLPLNYLLGVSFMGIVAISVMVVLIFVCGFITTEQPGSLLNPMTLNLLPKDGSFANVMLSIGLFMAPWGGHPVFPELYSDLKHKYKYHSNCHYSFSLTVLIDFSIAVFGYLMYGRECQELLIKNLVSNPNYPHYFKSIFMVIVGILPLLKMPLLGKPIITTYENLLHINKDKMSVLDNIKKIGCRVIFVGTLMGLSLMTKSFGKVVAFVGSSICFALCIIFPFMFKLSIFKHDLTNKEKFWLYVGIAFGIIGGVLGTVGVVIGD